MELSEEAGRKQLREYARRKALRMSDSILYRLANLQEEMGEVQQALAKSHIFGMHSYHPDRPWGTNQGEIEKELGHVLAAISVLCEYGDLSQQRITAEAIRKWAYLTDMDDKIRDRAVRQTTREGGKPLFFNWPEEASDDQGT